MIIRKKQGGYSLVELILVMALSSMAFVATVNYEVKRVDIQRAEAIGGQFSEVGKALSSYLAREQLTLAANIPSGTTATLPLTVLMGTNSGAFVGRNYLPTTFNPNNGFGTGYTIQVRNNAGNLQALVVSTAPICDKGSSMACPSANNPIRYDLIGAAMRKMGANSGMTFNSAVTMSGFNAGWTLPNAQFNQINRAGLLGFRVSSTDTSLYDAMYLRLDGTSVMRGSLNMGNFDIQNATNITYNGWAQGNGLLVNTINSGTINNSGNINTANLAATNQVSAGAQANNPLFPIGTGSIVSDNSIRANNSIISRNTITALGAITSQTNITAMGTMRTQDVYLGSNPSAPGTATGRALPNAWLSDLLPRYSSRGIYLVSNGTTLAKPTCPSGATAKIELIPQMVNMQGRVLGPLTLNNPTNTSIYIAQNQFSYSKYVIYAADLGWGWQANMITTNYDTGPTYYIPAGTSIPMQGLAHVYCDFNF